MKPLLIMFFLASCGNSVLTYDAEKIQEVEKVNEKSCRLLGWFDGKVIGGLSDYSEDTAKRKAKNEAAKEGATHIIWVKKHNKDGLVHKVAGKAYKCF